MKRAACEIVGSALLKSHEVTYHIDDLRRVENPVYSVLRYHPLLFVYRFIFVNDLLHFP